MLPKLIATPDLVEQVYDGLVKAISLGALAPRTAGFYPALRVESLNVSRDSSTGALSPWLYLFSALLYDEVSSTKTTRSTPRTLTKLPISVFSD